MKESVLKRIDSLSSEIELFLHQNMPREKPSLGRKEELYKRKTADSTGAFKKKARFQLTVTIFTGKC